MEGCELLRACSERGCATTDIFISMALTVYIWRCSSRFVHFKVWVILNGSIHQQNVEDNEVIHA